jgi:hypothetical protein
MTPTETEADATTVVIHLGYMLLSLPAFYMEMQEYNRSKLEEIIKKASEQQEIERQRNREKITTNSQFAIHILALIHINDPKLYSSLINTYFTNQCSNTNDQPKCQKKIQEEISKALKTASAKLLQTIRNQLCTYAPRPLVTLIENIPVSYNKKTGLPIFLNPCGNKVNPPKPGGSNTRASQKPSGEGGSQLSNPNIQSSNMISQCASSNDEIPIEKVWELLTEEVTNFIMNDFEAQKMLEKFSQENTVKKVLDSYNKFIKDTMDGKSTKYMSYCFFKAIMKDDSGYYYYYNYRHKRPGSKNYPKQFPEKLNDDDLALLNVMYKKMPGGKRKETLKRFIDLVSDRLNQNDHKEILKEIRNLIKFVLIYKHRIRWNNQEEFLGSHDSLWRSAIIKHIIELYRGQMTALGKKDRISFKSFIKKIDRIKNQYYSIDDEKKKFPQNKLPFKKLSTEKDLIIFDHIFKGNLLEYPEYIRMRILYGKLIEKSNAYRNGTFKEDKPHSHFVPRPYKDLNP